MIVFMGKQNLRFWHIMPLEIKLKEKEETIYVLMLNIRMNKKLIEKNFSK